MSDLSQKRHLLHVHCQHTYFHIFYSKIGIKKEKSLEIVFENFHKKINSDFNDHAKSQKKREEINSINTHTRNTFEYHKDEFDNR